MKRCSSCTSQNLITVDCICCPELQRGTAVTETGPHTRLYRTSSRTPPKPAERLHIALQKKISMQSHGSRVFPFSDAGLSSWMFFWIPQFHLPRGDVNRKIHHSYASECSTQKLDWLLASPRPQHSANTGLQLPPETGNAIQDAASPAAQHQSHPLIKLSVVQQQLL